MRLDFLPAQVAKVIFFGLVIAVLLVQNLHGAVMHDTGGARLVGFGLPLRFALRDALGFQNSQWLWNRPELIETFRIGALAINILVACLIVLAMRWRYIQIERSQWQVSIIGFLIRTLVIAISLRLAFLIHMRNLHLFSEGLSGSIQSLILNFAYIWTAFETLIVATIWISRSFCGLAALNWRRSGSKIPTGD